MVSKKFKTGDIVNFRPGRRSLKASASAYTVTRVLPVEHGQNIYRVKCSTEPFERIAKEGELSERD